jgi:oligosaccharide repeat unit polymerase
MKDPSHAPAPLPRATVVFLMGLAGTVVAAPTTTAAEVAHGYAIGVGLSILASLALEYRRNLRNLVRADVMAIASLYFLTLFEFLLPQPEFNLMVTLEDTKSALVACLFGFAGLALGRHIAPTPPASLRRTLHDEFSARAFLSIYTVCLIGGYFHMLLAVDFNFMEMVRYFMTPRFTQPWGRGKFGDWKALIGELGMVLYLVPPIAGIVIARRKEYTKNQLIYVVVTFLFTLFYGFSSGTRTIFASYLATFLVAFAFAHDQRRRRELIAVGALCATLMLFATVTMLQFRNIGLDSYLAGERENEETKSEKSFFVDYNLYVISKLVAVFPEQHDYLGLEIPYLSIIRPIPRAIWKSKPEGLSISIEDAVGVEGLTLASSFVGEGYMSGGLLGVFLTGSVFGAVAGWWNRLGRGDNSPFGHLVFASGFFAAVISMRSMFVFTTAILPTIAALLLGNWVVSKRPLRRSHVEPAEPTS